MDDEPQTYLGDGAYARFDGFAFWLRAPRQHGDHFICLEPAVLHHFLDFVHEHRPNAIERYHQGE